MELVILALIGAQTTYLTVNQLFKISKRSGKYIFVDTSVLIDGRIRAVAEAGFLPGTLAIPRSVVGELQFLADNGDTEKRTRARHGLDVIKDLQSIDSANVIIFADSTKAEEGVDNRLLSLAKRHKGIVCTIDYNLNKVAQVEGIAVLNVNDLAKSLRMSYLPGEKTVIELTQKGNDSHQGVGHLSDGTMVVVENAQKYIGKSVEVEFIRSLQTSAGKMMFAKLSNARKSSVAAPKAPGVIKTAKTVKPATARAKPTVAGTKPAAPRGNNRRRNVEDSLVELANK